MYVVFEVAREPEALPARFTLERSLPGVQTHVIPQKIVAPELLATLTTHLVTVRAHMPPLWGGHNYIQV